MQKVFGPEGKMKLKEMPGRIHEKISLLIVHKLRGVQDKNVVGEEKAEEIQQLLRTISVSSWEDHEIRTILDLLRFLEEDIRISGRWELAKYAKEVLDRLRAKSELEKERRMIRWQLQRSR